MIGLYHLLFILPINGAIIFFCVLEIPVLPTITAKITFQGFDWSTDLDDSLFLIPEDFNVSDLKYIWSF